MRWLLGAEVRHFDVAVVSPCAPHAVTCGSHTRTLCAGQLTAEQKQREYRGPLQQAGLQPDALVPLVWEVTARPGSELHRWEAWLSTRTATLLHDIMATLLREKADVLPLLVGGCLHPRIGLALLRACVATRLMHWARTLSPAVAERPFAEFDLRIDEALATQRRKRQLR